MFQDIIDSYDEEPLRAKKSLPAPAVDPLLASAFEVADKSRVYIDHEVLSYIYANERYQGYGDAQAFREVMNYISDAESVHSKVLTSYTELLPDGHPRRPDAQSRADLAEYLSTQAPESVEEALIASISADPGSIERQFNSYAIREAGVDYSYLISLADSLVAAAADPRDIEKKLETPDEREIEYLIFLDKQDLEDREKYDDALTEDSYASRGLPSNTSFDPDNADYYTQQDRMFGDD